MRGEFIGVWSEMWRAVWSKLAKHPAAPDDLFCELYRELVLAFVTPADVTALADIVDVPAQARAAFRRTKAIAFRGELALLEFLERAHAVTVDLGGDALSNRYFLLVEAFLEKFSLRYDLRRPFSLHPTLSGVFARLVRELKRITAADPSLHPLMIEFEEAVRDIRKDHSSGKIKTCIQKQMNLLEAIGQQCPGVTSNQLGGICDQIATWPHGTIKEAMKKLYGFASNYPGIRHAGNPASQLREIEMRHLVAVTVLLAGFTPYLSDLLNGDDIYCSS